MARSILLKITLFGVLREKLARENRGKLSLKLAEGSVLQDAKQALGIQSNALCVLNGVNQSDLTTPLKDGDEIAFFLPIGGGVS